MRGSQKDDEFTCLVRSCGGKRRRFLQTFPYEQFLRTHYEGRSTYPPHTHFLSLQITVRTSTWV
jgi:hypothetical protein